MSSPIVSLSAWFRSPAAPGFALLAATAAALILANSPLAAGFRGLWDTHLAISVGGHGVDKSLGHWISDGLMAIFFFVVGLELKREILVGHLSSPRRAALPIIAAAGGMIAPATIFALLNLGQDGVPRAWGVPIATDIAFALGILSMLGRTVPVSLRIFLAALAIADDVGAVLVIALFYTDGIAWPLLAGGGAALALSLALNRCGVRWPLPYALLGMVLWVLFLESGVHATIAGVLLALTIPTASSIDTRAFAQTTRALVDRFAEAGDNEPHIMTNDERQEAVHRIERHCERVRAPLQRIEHALHPWVAWLIMPLFALANAGVAIDADSLRALTSPLAGGVVAGLVLGKPIGVFVATWIAVKAGVAALPDGVGWRHIHGAGWLAGIGFTMSLFIAGLAIGEDATLATAKLAVLVASAIAGAIGCLLLRGTPLSSPGAVAPPPPPAAAP